MIKPKLDFKIFLAYLIYVNGQYPSMILKIKKKDG